MADVDAKIESALALDPIEPVAERKPRRWLRPLLMFGVPLLVLAVAGFFWATSGRYVSTENAYIDQDKVSVSSDVTGKIVKVNVKENQPVHQGDVLFEIDPEPYRIAVAQANAAIANAQVALQTLETSYQGKGADIQAARDKIQQAQEDLDRKSALMTRGFVTRADLLDAQHAVEQARAAYQSALADEAEAKSKIANGAAVPGENPAIAAARVQRAKAELDLSRTVIRAPESGVASQTERLQLGQMMMTGLPAVTIVKSNATWVGANFKETDLNKMRVGQAAEIRFDAYPGLKLKGHVQSIGAGTGSEFSVLPAQNATGNWVKVTQRVPVRIAIDEPSPRPLIAGLSVSVKVDVRGNK